MSTAPNTRADRIAVVDDDARIRDLLRRYLTQEGFEVLLAEDAKALNRVLTRETVNLIVLDLMLPGEDGLSICRRLRAANDLTPIIMLTAKVEDVDRIVGLEVGADDYVVKPFSVRELLLRIDALLRRGKDRVKNDQPVEFGCLRIDREAHRVWVKGLEIELTALEFKLLSTLLERKNRVQSRGSLLSDVWGIEADITTRTVDTHVKRLREKLGAAGDYVETVRGVGYRFAETPNGPPQ
ncbi:MAG TPA: response regulator [Polyangiales bacterium]|nr:response regulator [Polyangiales bacterium]